ncbi:DoxX family protein [Streptomyces antibioticus]|uniref:DoxX family protein n=1 Tax=Streptomyces antibioticus TaxID=1890 RepID=UPI0033A4DD75
MSIAYIAVASLIALVLLASGRAKLVKDEKITEGMHKIGVPDSWFPRLSALEIAAAIGMVAYFVGAVLTHLRAKDTAGVPLPATLLVAGAAALVLGVATV